MSVSTVLPSVEYTQNEAKYERDVDYDINKEKQEVMSQDKQDLTSEEYPSDSGLMTSRNSSQDSKEEVKKY